MSLEKGEAEVEFENGAVSLEQMIEAIKRAGYSAKLLEASGQGR